MGLFSSDHGDVVGRKMLDVAIRRFNGVPGLAFSVDASLHEQNLRQCCDTFRRVSHLGFPDDPGPFKRLGAFACFAQAMPLFNVKNALGPDIPDILAIWLPRLVVWTLPVFAAALEVDGEARCIDDFVLPTPHFQVEFIGYLRNMFKGSEQTGQSPPDALLLERATATGLILEACAYMPINADRPNRSLYSKAATCLDAIAADELLVDDWRFNDPAFLELAVGIGVE